MLKAAQLYEAALNAEFLKFWYDPEYIYFDGSAGHSLPDLPDNCYDSHNFVSVDKGDRVLGFISYAGELLGNKLPSFLLHPPLLR